MVAARQVDFTPYGATTLHLYLREHAGSVHRPGRSNISGTDAQVYGHGGTARGKRQRRTDVAVPASDECNMALKAEHGGMLESLAVWDAYRFSQRPVLPYLSTSPPRKYQRAASHYEMASSLPAGHARQLA